jgi:hypothetical protein
MIKRYTVSWVIDVDAENELEASKQAREIQLDKDSTATIFNVYEDDTREPVEIDLLELT